MNTSTSQNPKLYPHSNKNQISSNGLITANLKNFHTFTTTFMFENRDIANTIYDLIDLGHNCDFQEYDLYKEKLLKLIHDHCLDLRQVLLLKDFEDNRSSIECFQNYCYYASPNIKSVTFQKNKIIFHTCRSVQNDSLKSVTIFSYNGDLLKISPYEKQYLIGIE
jgi:hypothetical protein